jgi:hypothetical protein
VQNYRIIPDFDLFLHGKNGGPSPRAMDHARVGRGWRWLGRPKAKARWGGRPVAGPREREAVQERRRGVG